MIGAVVEAGGEQATHGRAGRIGLVLCYRGQAGATGGQGRVVDRGNGHCDAVAGGAEGRAVDGCAQRQRPAGEAAAIVCNHVISDIQRPNAVGVGTDEFRQLTVEGTGNAREGVVAFAIGQVGRSEGAAGQRLAHGRQLAGCRVIEGQGQVAESIAASGIGHQQHLLPLRANQQDVEIL
ncbi:hypothetical protein D3C84_238700 [compost metagenome]